MAFMCQLLAVLIKEIKKSYYKKDINSLMKIDLESRFLF